MNKSKLPLGKLKNTLIRFLIIQNKFNSKQKVPTSSLSVF